MAEEPAPGSALLELFLAARSFCFRTPNGGAVWIHSVVGGWVISDSAHLRSPAPLYDPTQKQPLFRDDGEVNYRALTNGWVHGGPWIMPLSRALELAGGPTWAPHIAAVRRLEEKYPRDGRPIHDLVQALRAWAEESGEEGPPLCGSRPTYQRTLGGITVRVDPANSSMEVTREGDSAPALRTNLQGYVWEQHATWPEVYAELDRLLNLRVTTTPNAAQASADP